MEMLPKPLLECFIFILGLCIGSFLNVVIARLPAHESLARPGSRCPKCRTAIRWYFNIPIFSYLALRGRCHHCCERISPRYPVVQLMTGLLFLAAGARCGLTWELPLRAWPWVSLLVVITFIDLDHRLIPDRLSLPGLVLGLATAFLDPTLGWIASMGGAALGFGIFYFFAWAYQKATGRSGLGGGDIKLLAMIGAFVGPSGVFATILVSSIFGSLVGIFYAIATRREKMMTLAIPYGPFLVVGALYYYLFGESVWLRFMTPT